MADNKNKYPPKFDDTLLYPRILNLDAIDVFLEDETRDSKYFSVTKLPESIGYGKHYFNISYKDTPRERYSLRNNSEILFEAKDSNGTVIFSDTTTIANVSGEAISYLWVKEDPLRTYKDIADGIGTLTIVGELDNVPQEWVNKYNVRLTIPLNIRKETPNTSPILLKDEQSIIDNITIHETVEANMDNPNFNRSYVNISMSKLDTYGGKINQVEVAYIESGSILSASEWTYLGTYDVTPTGSMGKLGVFENNIDEEYAKGLNPRTNFRQLQMPVIPHQSGSTFDGAHAQIKFQFKFLNAAGDYAENITASGSEVLEVTSSYVEFQGPATVIQGDENLIDGQVYIGNSVGTGIEVNASSSAYLRSIGYLGFDSASDASLGGAPGFIIYTGSILGQNTDEYAAGGVGLELVQDADNYLKFNTAQSELDIHTEKFFIGKESLQYISASNGLIEISSSKFHLKNDGDVIISGTVTAQEGTIGGWTIGPDKISKGTTSAGVWLRTDKPGVTVFGNNDKRVYFGQIHDTNAWQTEYGIIAGDWTSGGEEIYFRLTDTTKQISGWTIGTTNLSNIDGNGGISIDASNKIITARTGSASDTVRVRFGQINANEYGIQGEDASGNVIFNLGEQGNNIAGWSIGQSTLTSDSMSIDAAGSEIFKPGSGSTIGLDAGSGLDERYFIDFTPEQGQGRTDGATFYVRFGPNFAVSESGQLYASGAVIEGVLTADDGTIGGWNIGTGSLYSAVGDNVYVGMSSQGDTAFFASASAMDATSSAAFNVKHDGTMTASKAYIDGTSEWAGTTIVMSKLEGVQAITDKSSSLEASGSITKELKDKSGSFEIAGERASGLVSFTGSTFIISASDMIKDDISGSFKSEATSIRTETSGTIGDYTSSLSSSLKDDIKKGIDDAATADAKAVTAEANAQTGITNAATADAKAVTAEANAQTGISNAATALSTANSKADPSDVSQSIHANTGSLKTKVDSDISNVRVEVSGTVGDYTSSLKTIVDSDISNVRTEVSGTVGDYTSSLKTIVDSDISNVRTEVSGTVGDYTSSLKTIVDSDISNVRTEVSGTVGDYTSSLKTIVDSDISNVRTEVSGTVGDYTSSLKTIVDSDISNVRTEVSGTVGDYTSSLKTIVDSDISNVRTEVSGTVGDYTSSLKTIVDSDISNVRTEVSGTVGDYTSSLKTIVDSDISNVRTEVSGTVGDYTSSLKTIVDSDISNVRTEVSGTVGDYTSSLKTIVDSDISNVRTEVSGTVGDYTSSLKTIVDSDISNVRTEVSGTIEDYTSSLSQSISTTNDATQTSIISNTTDLGNVRTEVSGTIDSATGSFSASIASDIAMGSSSAVYIADASQSWDDATTRVNADGDTWDTVTTKATPEDVSQSIDAATGSLSQSIITTINYVNKGLKAHWTFDDSINPYTDVTGNGYSASLYTNGGLLESNGSWLESARWTSVEGGKVGRGIQSEVSGAVRILKDSDLTDDIEQTYTLWYKPSGWNDTSTDRIISRDCSDWWCIAQKTFDGDNEADLLFDYGDNEGSAKTFGDAVKKDEWTFIALSIDYNVGSASSYIYRTWNNTSETDSRPISWPTQFGGEATVQARAIILGDNSEDPTSDNTSNPNQFASGTFDDVRYYDKSLTATEVDNLYQYYDYLTNTEPAISSSVANSQTLLSQSVETDFGNMRVETSMSIDTATGSLSQSISTTNDATQTSIVTAQSTADTAEANAQTGITNAATADAKAVTAQGTANTAVTNAATAQSTADTAESNAQTGITNAATAQSTADGKASPTDVTGSFGLSSDVSMSIDTATGSLSQSLESNINKGINDAATAQSTADTAESNAQTGISNASAAQNTANTAVTNAATAQSTADTAESNAQIGITNAATADAKAVTAQGTANTAVTNAATAQSTADGKASPTDVTGSFGLQSDISSSVDTATGSLSQSLEANINKGINDAATAQSTADTAESNAQTGISNAATAQGTANTAVTNAATAQSTADTAVTNAATAQSTADTAETNAQTGISNAATAQGTANTAVTNAATAQSTADGKASPTDVTGSFGLQSDISSSVDTATGSLSQSLEANINKGINDAAAAQSTADTAETNAQTGISNAATAQSTADTAETNAQTGITNAATAQNTANTAVTNAATAQSTADTAETNAQTGITNAAAAQSTADGKANPSDVTASFGLISDISESINIATGSLSSSLAPTIKSELLGGAGEALDTLNELANALGNDENFSTTVATNLAGKAEPADISQSIAEYTSSLSQSISTTNDTTQTAIVTAQSTADTAESNAAAAQSTADGKASPTDVTGSFGLSSDISMSIDDATGSLSQSLESNINKGINDAATAQSTADTAESNAQTGITNAATADAKAVAAQSTANTAESNAQTGITNAATAQNTANTAVTNAATAQSTADTAETNAQTGISNAATAQSTADTAETNAQTGITNAATAQSTADGKASPTDVTGSFGLQSDISSSVDTATGSLSQSLEANINKGINDAATAQSTADTAETNAQTGISNAATAQGTANTAVTNAATAQSTADTAETNAQTGITNAATAQSTADTAESNAQTAITNAATADAKAVTAQGTANTAVTNAATAQSTADTAETNAQTGISNAATAQSTADTAETNAQTGISNAATAQGTANTAVTNAATAQSTADTAETNAQTGITNAATAQSTADTAVTNAATAQSTADGKASPTDVTGSFGLSSDISSSVDTATGSLSSSLAPDIANSLTAFGGIELNCQLHWSFDNPDFPMMNSKIASATASNVGTEWHTTDEGKVGGAIVSHDGGGLRLQGGEGDDRILSDTKQTWTFWVYDSGEEIDNYSGGGWAISSYLSRGFGIPSNGDKVHFGIGRENSFDSEGKARIEWHRHDSNPYTSNTDMEIISGSWNFVAMTMDYENDESNVFYYSADSRAGKPKEVVSHSGLGWGSSIDPDWEEIPVTLGCLSGDADNVYQDSANVSASFDEVRYYNKILTGPEIEQLVYSSEHAPGVLGLSGSVETDFSNIRVETSMSIDTATGSLSQSISTTNDATQTAIVTAQSTADTAESNAQTGISDAATAQAAAGLAQTAATNANNNANSRALPADVTSSVHANTGSLSQSLATQLDTDRGAVAAVANIANSKASPSDVSQSIYDNTSSLSQSMADEDELIYTYSQNTQADLNKYRTDSNTGSYHSVNTDLRNWGYVETSPGDGATFNHDGGVHLKQWDGAHGEHAIRIASGGSAAWLVQIGCDETQLSERFEIRNKSFATKARSASIGFANDSPFLNFGGGSDVNPLVIDGAGISLDDGANYVISRSVTGNITTIAGDNVGNFKKGAYFDSSGKIHGTFVGQSETTWSTDYGDCQWDGRMIMTTGSDPSSNGPECPLTLAIFNPGASSDYEAGDGCGLLFKFQTSNAEPDGASQAGMIATTRFSGNDDDQRSNMDFWINPNESADMSLLYSSTGRMMQISCSGDLNVKRDIIGFATATTSDKRLKDNITSLTKSIDIIQQLEPKSFTWNSGSSKDGEFSYGLIAQEVEKVLPEVVQEKYRLFGTDDDTLYKTVNYTELIPHLIESIKEQQRQIDELKTNSHPPQDYREQCDELKKEVKKLKIKINKLNRKG